MKRLKVKRNRLKWHNVLALIILIATMIGLGAIASIFVMRYITFFAFIALVIYDILLDMHYFIYDPQGIITSKIGRKRGVNIWFVDMFNIDLKDSTISFEHHIKRWFRKPKVKSYKFNLSDFASEDVHSLKQVFIDYCDPSRMAKPKTERIRRSNKM